MDGRTPVEHHTMNKYNGYIVCRAVWDTAVCIEELYAFVADRYSGHCYKQVEADGRV